VTFGSLKVKHDVNGNLKNISNIVISAPTDPNTTARIPTFPGGFGTGPSKNV